MEQNTTNVSYWLFATVENCEELSHWSIDEDDLEEIRELKTCRGEPLIDCLVIDKDLNNVIETFGDPISIDYFDERTAIIGDNLTNACRLVDCKTKLAIDKSIYEDMEDAINRLKEQVSEYEQETKQNVQLSNYEQQVVVYLFMTDLSEQEALGAIIEVRKALYGDVNVPFDPQGLDNCPDVKRFGDVLIHSDFVSFLKEYGYEPNVEPEDYNVKETEQDWDNDYGVKDNPDFDDTCGIEDEEPD